jgi:hypothetical protein
MNKNICSMGMEVRDFNNCNQTPILDNEWVWFEDKGCFCPECEKKKELFNASKDC